jgi:hypothetical protein
MGRKKKYPECPFNYGTKEYQQWYSREWYKAQSTEQLEIRNLKRTQDRRNKKSKWVQKLGSRCKDCGNSYPDSVFEFHHIDSSTKDRDPSQLFMLSDENISKELEKCILLCANCHRIRHD